jgi:DNA polymerase-3 subunit beta
LTLTGTNHEIAIQCKLKVSVEMSGGMVIDAKLFSRMVELFAGEDISMEVGSNPVCTLRSGTAMIQLAVKPAKHYPKPDIPFPEGAVRISNICSSAKNSVFAASKTQDKPVMTGIRLEVNGKQVRACGCDGIRLMERQQELENGGKLSFVIPAHSFKQLAECVKDSDTLEVGVTGSSVVFVKEGFLFSAKLINGVYIDVDNMLSAVKPEYTALVDATELYKALGNVSVISGDSGRVNLSFRDDSVRIALKSDSGSSQTAVQAVVMKESPTDGFFYAIGYLQEAFRRMIGNVEIQLSTFGILTVKTDADTYFQIPMQPPKQKTKPKPKAKTEKKAA